MSRSNKSNSTPAQDYMAGSKYPSNLGQLDLTTPTNLGEPVKRGIRLIKKATRQRQKPAETASSLHPTNKKPAEPAFLTVKELAIRWRISTRQIHRIIKSEQLPVFGPGRLVRIAMKDIIVFEAANTSVT